MQLIIVSACCYIHIAIYVTTDDRPSYAYTCCVGCYQYTVDTYLQEITNWLKLNNAL